MKQIRLTQKCVNYAEYLHFQRGQKFDNALKFNDYYGRWPLRHFPGTDMLAVFALDRAYSIIYAGVQSCSRRARVKYKFLRHPRRYRSQFWVFRIE